MRVVKFVCCLGLLAGLAVAWRTRDLVVAAYTEERPPTELRLTGGGFAFVPTPIEASPFALDLDRPDLRRAVVALPPGLDAGTYGATADSPGIGGGTAELTGTVTGPDGPVEGAVVLLERVLVERHGGGRPAEARVVTQADGTWRAGSLLGGRFRVRAFVPDLLTSIEPQVFFLTEGERRTLTFDLRAPDPVLRMSLHATGAHYLGLRSPAAVTLGRETVDDQGRLVVGPAAGWPVTLTVTGAASLATTGLTTTDGAGVAHFAVTCNALGPAQIRVTATPLAEPAAVASNVVLDLPACQSLPEPEPSPEGEPVPAPDDGVVPEGGGGRG